MSNNNSLEILILSPGTIHIGHLEGFLKVLNYQSGTSKVFPKAFELSDNLINSTGGALYPKGTELSADRIDKLLKLKESNPDYEFKLALKKSPQAANFFREQIIRDFSKTIESKKNRQEYRKSIGRLEKTVNMYIGDILKSDELVYTLYRARAIDMYTSKSGIPRYFLHQVNVTLFALEILQNSLMTTGIRFDKNDLINIGILCLVHDISGMENLGDYADLPVEKIKEYYLQDMKQNYLMARMMNLEDDLIDALKKLGDFHNGDKEVLFDNDEDMSTNYANILATADVMDLKVSGLFDERMPIKAATDQLYVMANEKILRRGFVDSLAKGLKLTELFDFYREIDRLNKACLLKDFAKPYPMLGFKSPVIYLCGGRKTNCPEYAKSSKSVNLIKASSGLEPGSYGRCKLLSNELVKFYQSHYSDIKENVMLREGENKRKGDKE